MPDLIAAVKAGDAAAVEALLAKRPGAGGAGRGRHPGGADRALPPPAGACSRRCSPHSRRSTGSTTPRSAGPATCGATSRATPSWSGAAQPTASRRCTTPASSAVRPRPPCCSRPAPTRTPRRTNRCACGRCTRPPRRATGVGAAAARGGADPDARQRRLHRAAGRGAARRRRVRALLLRHGADPALRNDQGADAAGIARANESVAVLALLGAPTATGPGRRARRRAAG